MNKEFGKNVAGTQDTIGHQIRMIHNSIGKYMENCKRKSGVGLTGAQFATIHYLIMHQEETTVQKDIEHAFSISAATATNLLQVLEREKIVERVAIEGDARKKKIVLLDRAYELDACSRKSIMEVEAAMTQGMSEEDVAIFRENLHKVAQNIVELCNKSM